MNKFALAARVLEVLQFHIGHHSGLPSKALAEQCGASTRDIRLAITELREDGVGVCGTPGTGYFLAATDLELERYCLQFLRQRALHSLMIISVLSRTALPDLLGQMRLPT